MENAPILSLAGISRFPGADLEAWDRYNKWLSEVYATLLMKAAERTGMDIYQIVRESPEYPSGVFFVHYLNLSAWQDARKIPESAAITEEFRNWQKRNVIDYAWSGVYQLVKSFRNVRALSGTRLDSRIENASVMHFEAYRLSPEEQDKYNAWFAEYAVNIFMPLFMKLPGLKGYDFYKHTGFAARNDVRETEFPASLSVVYFENIQAFENFEKSIELETFRKTMWNVFPRGLNFKWYVQYQLTQSWRK